MSSNSGMGFIFKIKKCPNLGGDRPPGSAPELRDVVQYAQSYFHRFIGSLPRWLVSVLVVNESYFRHQLRDRNNVTGLCIENSEKLYVHVSYIYIPSPSFSRLIARWLSRILSGSIVRTFSECMCWLLCPSYFPLLLGVFILLIFMRRVSRSHVPQQRCPLP